MITLNKKYLSILPCVVILILFSTVHFFNLKTYYDEILASTGLVFEDFERELREENERAIKSEQEYQKIVEPQGSEDEIAEKPKIEDLRLNALSALLLDASNNRVLYEENGYDEMPMASTTKIMTCIVTLEHSKPDEIVTVSDYAAKMPDVQLNIKANEQFYIKDLLYSLMLESHNDVAVAIAEHVGGSVEGFATMMNDKARSLGCKNTNFVTPNGLDAEGHYTTAHDLAVIASYAIKNDKFIEITNTSTYQFKEISKGKGFSVSNKNRFLYMMDGAIGVKTGFTGDAGYCFVGAVKRLDRTLISVVLACGWPPSKNLKWSDTKKLMNYGIENFKLRQIYDDKQLEPLFVKDGQKKNEVLSMNGDISLLMSDNEIVDIEYDMPKVLEAPVEKGCVIGHAKYYINHVLYTEIPIYTTESIKKIDYSYCLKKILSLWSIQN
jgi:D-alanyl-D-alanine carboxypeptidase (penicillin-binding protein 5/6)